jgi:protein-L-isoaspartate(D-aspartate) O-methyltransferase
MNIELARYNMIEQQIRPWGVLSPVVLELLAAVKREDFVPATHRALAFVDTEIALSSSSGTASKPCMLSPKVEARLLQELNIHKQERVLEVGAGSGHMAALLAHLSQDVISLEIDPELSSFATANLTRAGVMNARVVTGNGAMGLPLEGPFDVILLSGSVAEVPDALLAQLKIGGRLAAIIGQEPMMQATLITRNSDRGLTRSVLFDTVTARLQAFTEPTKFQF